MYICIYYTYKPRGLSLGGDDSFSEGFFLLRCRRLILGEVYTYVKIS